MITLKKEYISIYDDLNKSYGGNQNWWEHKHLQAYGCGLIAATDVMLYLGAGNKIYLEQRNHAGTNTGMDTLTYSRSKYHQITMWFNRYFQVLPKLGMSGLVLCFGFYRCFRRLHMPYKVGWGVSTNKLYDSIKEMLQADIPVILSVGPNFPKFWKQEGVMLYTKNKNGQYVENQSTYGHYVTVTGMDQEYLQVSSWGRCYYMRWSEYKTYRKKKSLALFTNICYIRKRNET